MFLIEGDGKSILYTGDIRAESWWIESLKRHPVLLPYTTGIKTLNKIYLDTTNANTELTHSIYSSKRDGISELLTKIGEYPDDTIFHFNTWTFGYEDVWVAIASHFKSQIHVDSYRYGLYSSIADCTAYQFGPYLKGYKCGNTMQETILTTNWNARFHSCERGLGCPGLDNAKRIVYISPIIGRYQHPKTGRPEIMCEPGESAGRGDLDFVHFLEISRDLTEMLAKYQSRDIADLIPSDISQIPLKLDPEDLRDLTMEELSKLLRKTLKVKEDILTSQADLNEAFEKWNLKEWFGFPFSRHSSYNELQEFVRAFHPKDVYPCVAEDGEWRQNRSIEYLFGDLCSGTKFDFDEEVKFKLNMSIDESYAGDETGETQYDEETQGKETQEGGSDTEEDEFIVEPAPRMAADSGILASSSQDGAEIQNIVTGVVPANQRVSRSVKRKRQSSSEQEDAGQVTAGPSSKLVPLETLKTGGLNVTKSIGKKRKENHHSQEGSEAFDGGQNDVEDDNCSSGTIDQDGFLSAATAAVNRKCSNNWFDISQGLDFNSQWKYEAEQEL